jgi:predicted nucleotidyltransferase
MRPEAIMTKAHAITTLEAAYPALQRAYGLQDLWVYGSTARGEARSDSDVDVIVTFASGKTPGYFGLARLKRELEALLGTTVDLTTPGGLDPRLRKRITQEAVRVH